MSYDNETKNMFCNFCGKTEKEVKYLIAGPDVHVCEECIELCVDIIREKIPDFMKVD